VRKRDGVRENEESILPALKSGKAISDGVEKKTEIVLLALCPFCFLFDEEEKKSQGGFQYTLFFLIFIKTKALITKRGAFQ